MKDYYIRTRSEIVPGKMIILYKLNELSEPVFPHKATETLRKVRGMTQAQAVRYLRTLKRRGG